jgi:hypothetical protein
LSGICQGSVLVCDRYKTVTVLSVLPTAIYVRYSLPLWFRDHNLFVLFLNQNRYKFSKKISVLSDISKAFEVIDTYTSFEDITAFERRGIEEERE